MTDKAELSGNTVRLSLQYLIPQRGQVNGRRCKDGADIREDMASGESDAGRLCDR